MPSVRLVGESVQVRPVVGDIAATRSTDPAKPWREATVIVDAPLMLARTVTVVGPDERAKSCTV